MVKEKRLIENFIELTEFDSESFHEREIGHFVEEKLRNLGLEVRTDTTKEEYLKANPDSCPNIYGFLKGNEEGKPILFSAHLDTVAPGKGKKAVISEDGRMCSKGNTVLGADDISGIVSILEALEVIKENNLKHPDIEVLISPAEEPFCQGSKYLDYSLIKSKEAFVFDLTGPIGTAANRAPSIISFEIEVIGKASHAGFAPEDGINALSIAAKSLTEFHTGHIDEESTLNFGTISGGSGKNIVPERIFITGEVRSLSHKKALDKVNDVFRVFNTNSKKAGGLARCSSTENIRAFEVKEDDELINRFDEALRKSGIEHREIVTTFGGSDGNRFNENGIKTLVLACAMEKVHSTEEYTNIKELKKSAELALALATL